VPQLLLLLYRYRGTNTSRSRVDLVFVQDDRPASACSANTGGYCYFLVSVGGGGFFSAPDRPNERIFKCSIISRARLLLNSARFPVPRSTRAVRLSIISRVGRGDVCDTRHGERFPFPIPTAVVFTRLANKRSHGDRSDSAAFVIN